MTNFAYAAGTTRSYFQVKETAPSNDAFSGLQYTAVTQSINSGWSSSSKTNFAVRSGWIEIGGKGSQKWIELGFNDGTLSSNPNSNNHGVYYGVGSGSGYTDGMISGPSTNNGVSHTYQITYLSGNKYALVVDGTVYGYVNNTTSGGGWIQLGLESNNSNTTWATSTTINHEYKYSSNGIWSNWNNGSIYTTDPFNLGYHVQWVTQPTSATYYH